MKAAMRRRALGGALILALVAAPVTAWSETEKDPGISSEAGIGALAALSTLIYGPVKIAYATCGLIFGGVAWGLAGGDGEVLTAVITPSVRGDYVVTPEHIRLERGIEFFGRDPQYRAAVEPAAIASAPRSEETPAVSAGADPWSSSGVVEEDY